MNRQDIKLLLHGQECIVYLDSYSKAVDGILDAYIDFRQMKDLAMFRQIAELPENAGTSIELQSLKSAKRLMRGCYSDRFITHLR